MLAVPCQVMEFGFTRLLLDAFGRRILERPINIKRKTYRRAPLSTALHIS